MNRIFYLRDKTINIREIGDLFSDNTILDFNEHFFINNKRKKIDFDKFIDSLDKYEIEYLFDSFEKEIFPIKLKEKIYKISYYNLNEIVKFYKLYSIYDDYLISLFGLINRLEIYKNGKITEFNLKHIIEDVDRKEKYFKNILNIDPITISYNNCKLMINQDYFYRYPVFVKFDKCPVILALKENDNNSFILFSNNNLEKIYIKDF